MLCLFEGHFLPYSKPFFVIRSFLKVFLFWGFVSLYKKNICLLFYSFILIGYFKYLFWRINFLKRSYFGWLGLLYINSFSYYFWRICIFKNHLNTLKDFFANSQVTKFGFLTMKEWKTWKGRGGGCMQKTCFFIKMSHYLPAKSIPPHVSIISSVRILSP